MKTCILTFLGSSENAISFKNAIFLIWSIVAFPFIVKLFITFADSKFSFKDVYSSKL